MQNMPASFRWLRHWHTISILCLVCLSASEPIRADEFESVSGRAMGTTYCLKFSEKELKTTKAELAALVSEELERIESIFSLYRTESEISRLNIAPGGEWIQISEDLYAVAHCAVEIHQQTDGAFDPTLRQLMELWQGERLKGEWKPPSHESIEAARKIVGASHLSFQLDPPAIRKESSQVQLDLNALVEGWAIARVLEKLKPLGCSNALFEMGGEHGSMGHKSGSESWRIGIEDPRVLSRIYATVSLDNEAVCTSGSYRQVREYAGKHYSHLIDPRTGYPVEHDCLSVSVVHTDAMLADGWATALMVLGPDKGMQLANKIGVVASFACRSGNSMSPKVSMLADGKIMLANVAARSNAQSTSFVLAIVLFCSSAVVLCFVFRKRRVRSKE